MTSNKLKIVAIISMLIDHFAYYFYYAISSNVYMWSRILGRISMPIFVYLLIQGYFNTKSIKKYKIRLLVAAIVTQVFIIGMKYINLNYYSYYTISIYEILNILFSMFLSMILICLIDRKIIHANTFISTILDKLIRLVSMAVILVLYLKLPFDYKYFLPVLAIAIYIIERFREYFEWDFSNVRYKIVLGVILFILLFMSRLIISEIASFSVFAIIFIFLYNGKLGKKSKVLRNIFYLFFPLNHTIFYFLAMVLYNKLT